LSYFFGGTQEGNVQARQMFEKATELDPRLAWGPTLLGWTYWREWVYQWSQDPQTLERALALVRKAVALDDSSPMAHQLLGQVYVQKQQHERVLVEVERAIALAPDDADSYMHLGNILIYAGRLEDSVGVVEKGMRLKPRFPAFHLATLGNAYRLTGRYAEALDVLKKASLSPDYLSAHVYLAVIYGALDQKAEARSAVAEILRLSPHFSLEGLRQRLPYKDPAEAERYLVALGKAGLK
jgi:tetratricopeptide (TPR) repeat protein